MAVAILGSTITPTKVWYEFQCEYCNIDKVAEITGANNGKGYTNADRSLHSKVGGLIGHLAKTIIIKLPKGFHA